MDFDQTRYYASQMGENLKKQLWLLNGDFDAARLADLKRESIEWETEFADAHTEQLRVPRPLNIDPGYLTRDKLVLASTKDRGHRIYLRDGIYAEICLKFVRDVWEPLPWTYADYRTDAYLQFCGQCRNELPHLG